jgi:phospholipase C
MPDIQSVIVLMLENRSFDHMLGFLKHPDPAYHGLTGNESNPAAAPSDPPVVVTDTAKITLPVDPDHSHRAAMLQLTGSQTVTRPYQITNNGFVASYELKGLEDKKTRGFGPQIMRCQGEGNVPTLAALAKGFAVCTNWFCSVPGQTWPNRNFAHAGTSDGEVNIVKRRYTNRTIFEQLESAGRDWAVFHEGIPQVMCFPKVWFRLGRARFFDHDMLYWCIRNDHLPNYSFVEPSHFWPGSSSQHPGNNKCNGNDFTRGERLIAGIYSALKANPEVFAKTVFVITYDENGGFYDHVPPPFGNQYRDEKVSADDQFPFDLLGPRVPTVIVSPWIAKGAIDTTQYDHSSIPATVRSLFAPGAGPLSATSRDRNANTFLGTLTLQQPRDAASMPQLAASDPAETATLYAIPRVEHAPEEHELDEFQSSLVWLTTQVEAMLREEGVERERLNLPPMDVPFDDTNPASTASFAAEQSRVMQMVSAVAPTTLTMRDERGITWHDPNGDEIMSGLADVLASKAAKLVLSWNAMGALTVNSDGSARLVVNDDVYRAKLSGKATAELVRAYAEHRMDDVLAALRGDEGEPVSAGVS